MKQQKRTFSFPSTAVNRENRTVEVAFSSEEPYLRKSGYEVLSHKDGAVVTDRLRTGAAVLLHHDWTRLVGVIESFEIGGDGKGRAVVKLSRNKEGEEVLNDIEDGILKHISVGYFIHEIEETGKLEGRSLYTASKWEPYEISMVSVPADITVGVGRSAKTSEETEEETPHTETRIKILNERGNMPSPNTDAPATDPMVRVNTILEIGQKFKETDLAAKAIRDGKSVEQFQEDILEKFNTKMARPLSEQVRDNDIGLTDKETRQFSLIRLANALLNPSPATQEEAAFEFEACGTAKKQMGKNTKNFCIPNDILTRSLNTSTSGTSMGDTGGFLVAKDLMASSFIDTLRNESTILSLANPIGGLVGNVDIPKKLSSTQAASIAENEASQQTNITLGSISMSPKTVSGYAEISRRMLQQGSLDMEGLVRSDLAQSLALRQDYLAFYGAGGAKNPVGILNTLGVQAVEFDADYPTYQKLLHMEKLVAKANVRSKNITFVGEAGFREAMKGRVDFPTSAFGRPIWNDDKVCGYRALVTEQIQEEHVFMGDFKEMLIGFWGGIEINVDPFSKSLTGEKRIIAFADMDIALRRTAAFVVGMANAS